MNNINKLKAELSSYISLLIYDSWYADIRILGRLNWHAGITRRQVISSTAHVVLHAYGFPKPGDRYLYQIYERINIHIVKY